MPTWDELREHARTTYHLARDEEGYFSLIWSYDSGRSQQITVRRFSSFDAEWIEFRTFVCREDELHPRVAVRKNENFTIGALALDDDGDYCLIHSAPLATLDPEEFELPLRVLAYTADDLEREHSARDDH
jgi:hypothetical protein